MAQLPAVPGAAVGLMQSSVRHAVRVNGITGIALTKLDVLTGFKKIPICTGYRFAGRLYDEFPASSKVLENAEPVLEEMEGWSRAITAVRQFSELPVAAAEIRSTYREGPGH